MTRPPGYRLLDLVAMIFVAMLLISNTIAVKVVSLFGMTLPAGIICFPVAYIVNDVLTEVYGYRKSRRVIWYGFGCLGLMALLYSAATYLPPAPFWQHQKSFALLFGLAPRIAIASFVAFLVGSFLNAAVLSKMKIVTKGRWLWTRTIGSTIVGEGADSLVFNLAAFLFVFDLSDVLYIAFSGFVLKTAYEIAATPLTYMAVGVLKRYEGIDHYDHGVSYNPFRLEDR